MKCEKCGSEIKQLIISVSDAYGSDCSISVDITECEKNAVVFETDKSWTDMIKMVKMPIRICVVQYAGQINSKMTKYKFITF